MYTRMKPIGLLLLFAAALFACTAACATGDTITGTVIGFEDGNTILEEDGTKTRYALMPSLDIVLTGADAFEEGLRVEVSSFRLDESSSPAKLYPKRVNGLETWPTYIGFVLDVIQEDDGYYLFKMRTTEGTEFFIRAKEHADIEAFADKAAKIITEIGAPVPADGDVIDVRTHPLLEVYHGTITKSEPTFIEMEKSPDYANDGRPEKLRVSIVEETRIPSALAVGQPYVVALDQYTLIAYGIVPEWSDE